MRNIYCFFAVVAIAYHPSVPVALGEDPEPFDKDEFSGRTIVDADMALRIARERFFNAPRVGDPAPDFELPLWKTGEMVSLRQLYSKKPVVLLFGSYGCDVLRDGIDELNVVYERYRDKFGFAMVYIREAHSLDGFGKERARAEDPATLTERRALADKCRVALEVPFPILVDTIDDRTATRWAAWPIRLFVVDTDGSVVYSGKPGPWGFDPGRGFEAKGRELLRAHPDRFSQIPLEGFLRGFEPKGEASNR